MALKTQNKDLEQKIVKTNISQNINRFTRLLTRNRIRGLRKKLGISMRELGVLTGSSLGAVLSWEKGKFKPRGDKKAALVALRKLRKREVRKLLVDKAGSKVKAKGRRPKVKTRRKKPGKKVIRKKAK